MKRKLVSWDKYNDNAYKKSGSESKDFVVATTALYLPLTSKEEKKNSTITISVASNSDKIEIIDHLQSQIKRAGKLDSSVWYDLDLIISRHNVLHVMRVKETLVGFCCHKIGHENEILDIIVLNILPFFVGKGYGKMFVEFIESISPVNRFEFICTSESLNFWFIHGYLLKYKNEPFVVGKELDRELNESRETVYEEAIAKKFTKIIV